jgi:uncharacterized membrane protein
MAGVPGERTLRRTSGLVAVIGLGVATYIAIADAGGGAPTCLAGGGGCETVANSSYSHLAGINVAIFGIIGYVMLIGTAVFRGDGARFGGLLLALVGFGFSAYLTYLELFVIDAICQWCVASAALMTLLLILNAARAFAYAGEEIGGGEGDVETALTDPS